MSTHINNDFKRICVFTSEDGKEIEVTGVDEGIVKVDFSFEDTPELVARLLVGCFDKYSNFERIVGKAYNQGEEGWLKGIEISVFKEKKTFTRENASISGISEFLRKATEDFWKGFTEDIQKEFEKQRETITDITNAVKNEEIVVKDRASGNMWMSWIAWITDQGKEEKKIGAAAITFAKYVQFLIEKKNISTYFAFDKAYEDILLFEQFTENMLYKAIEILKRCWRYGEMLEDWFEKRQERELNNFLNSL